MAADQPSDPYRSCEHHCSHELGSGVLLSELLGRDGPHPPGYMLVALAPRPAPVLFDDDLVPATASAAR
jgi:hypothetical protein